MRCGLHRVPSHKEYVFRSAEMVELLWQIFREAESSLDVKLIVLKGAGDRAFCAGTIHAAHAYAHAPPHTHACRHNQ